jgi:site-specific recombinase XerD
MSVMKLGTLTANYLKYMDLVKSSSPLTLKAYVKDLDQAFGPCKNDIFQPKTAPQKLLALIRKAQVGWAHLAPASRNRKAATLKSFLGYLYREKLLDRDLSLLVQAPRVPQRIPHFLSVDEVLSVLATFDETDESETEKTLFLLLYGAGLRISEACNLKWSQFLPDQRSLRITGKGGKERLVVLPQGLSLRINRLKKEKTGEFLWGNKAIDQRKAYEIIRRRGAHAGLLKPLHPHALRHSYATHLLSSGANLRTLQELLGHESLRATEKYTHLGVDHLARTMENHHPFGNQNARQNRKIKSS